MGGWLLDFFLMIVDIVDTPQCYFWHFSLGWFFNKRALMTKSTKSTEDITSGNIFLEIVHAEVISMLADYIAIWKRVEDDREMKLFFLL